MGKSGEETHFHCDKAIYFDINLKVIAQDLLVARKQCILTWLVLFSHVHNYLISSASVADDPFDWLFCFSICLRRNWQKEEKRKSANLLNLQKFPNYQKGRVLCYIMYFLNLPHMVMKKYLIASLDTLYNIHEVKYFSFFLVCAKESVCAHIHVWAWGWCQERPLSFSHLIYWGIISLSNQKLVDMVGLASQLALETGITGGLPCSPRICIDSWNSKLRFSCFQGEHLPTEPSP